MNQAESIQERMRGLFPELLGIQFTEVTTEHVVATMEVRPDLCRSLGVLHGGAVMAFADTLGAAATMANLTPNTRTATIESKTNFVSSPKVGTRISGETTAIHRGRSTMVWQTRILSEEGKLVALVTQTQIVMPA